MAALGVDPGLLCRPGPQQQKQIIDRHLRIVDAIDQEHGRRGLPENAACLERHARAVGKEVLKRGDSQTLARAAKRSNRYSRVPSAFSCQAGWK